ncbi:RRP15-like protein, partial [Mucuna pruriens]
MVSIISRLLARSHSATAKDLINSFGQISMPSMAEEMTMLEPGRAKRKFVKNQGRKKSSKKARVMPPLHGQKKVKIDKKMKKLFRKRAREYNSDDEEDEATVPVTSEPRSLTSITNKRNEEDDIESEDRSEDEGAARRQETRNKNATDMSNHSSDDEGEDDNEFQPGITKFTKGCKAFKMAFRNIMNKSVPDDMLGPVLSGHRKLVIDKLAEEEAEREIKGEAKKEKQMLAEKGHAKPATYLDSHEKFLISVATKGVVKLFNAVRDFVHLLQVNKAQTAQKGLDPSRTKDAKEIRKRTKEAFFSELGKSSLPAISTPAKANESTGKVEDEQPAWAPLRDNYMLTSSRLKDWDKMPDKNVSDDIGKTSEDSTSDED